MGRLSLSGVRVGYIRDMQAAATSPGHSQILFLHSCEIKYGSGLGIPDEKLSGQWERGNSPCTSSRTKQEKQERVWQHSHIELVLIGHGSRLERQSF